MRSWREKKRGERRVQSVHGELENRRSWRERRDGKNGEYGENMENYAFCECTVRVNVAGNVRNEIAACVIAFPTTAPVAGEVNGCFISPHNGIPLVVKYKTRLGFSLPLSKAERTPGPVAFEKPLQLASSSCMMSNLYHRVAKVVVRLPGRQM